MPPFCNCGCLLAHHVDVRARSCRTWCRIQILRKDLVRDGPGHLDDVHNPCDLPGVLPADDHGHVANRKREVAQDLEPGLGFESSIESPAL